MHGAYSFPDIMRPGEVISLGNELANELSLPSYDFNAEGGVVVDSKKKLKMAGHPSPNIADALCLSEYFADIATRIWKKRTLHKKRPGAIARRTGQSRGRSWMTN